MRIMSLNEMLTMLRHEARISQDVAHATHLLEQHTSLLQRVQEEVYMSFDWPMLAISADVEITAGQRYATYPDTIMYEGTSNVHVRNAGETQWDLLGYGIRATEHNRTDSNAGTREEHIQRWAHYLASGAERIENNMFEIWPLPANDATLRFEGKRALYPLIDPDTDYSTIDGPVVVLHAAAEILAGQEAEDASMKLQKALARYDNLRRNQSEPDNRPVSMYPKGNRPANRGQRFRHD